MATDSTFNIGKVAASGLNNTPVKAQVLIDATAKSIATADSYPCIPIPAGALVLQMGIVSVTPHGSACTANIGDSGSATQYLSATSLNTAANTVTLSSTVNKYYAAADNIIVAGASAASSALKYKVFIVYTILE